ncbi:MAG: hypothetical protein ABIE23_03545 [archaeon]
MIEVLEFLVHFIAFVFIFLPLFVLWRIRSREYSNVIGLKSRNELIRSLNFIVVGLLPLAVIHLLEAISFFVVIEMVSHENFFYLLIEHSALVIAFISITWFLLKFEQIFVIELRTKLG